MKFKKLAPILLLVILFTGCAMLQSQLPQTPRDKSAVYMSYYMAQLRDYNARYAVAMQAEEVEALEVHILNAKYTFLMNAWQPIAIYDSYAAAGEIPPAELEAQINGLISMLENLVRGGTQ